MAERQIQDSVAAPIRVRPYEERDAEQVRELVIQGWCQSSKSIHNHPVHFVDSGNIEDSSLQVAMRSMWWEPICASSYPLSGLGLALLIKSGGGLFSILGGIMAFAFPILWVKFWQRKYAKLWTHYVQETLETGDLADIGRFYSRNKEADDDDGGVSGFWVAVATEGGQERIVGCAGLSEFTIIRLHRRVP